MEESLPGSRCFLEGREGDRDGAGTRDRVVLLSLLLAGQRGGGGGWLAVLRSGATSSYLSRKRAHAARVRRGLPFWACELNAARRGTHRAGAPFIGCLMMDATLLSIIVCTEGGDGRNISTLIELVS